MMQFALLAAVSLISFTVIFDEKPSADGIGLRRGVAQACAAELRAQRDVARQRQLVVQQFEISEDQFDSWMFQTSGNEAGCRKRLEASLGTELARLTQRFDLSESQQQKLRLAAQGDIKQFFDSVERARAFFLKNRTDQQAIQAVFQEIQPLQQQLASDFFGSESLFRKVLITTLDNEQSEALQALEEKQRVARHHQLVRETVLQAEKILPMVARQRDAFVELLTRHSRPPTKSSNYDSYVIMYYASEIPDEVFAEIFDKPQRDALRQFLQRGQQLKPFLEQQGLLAEEDNDE